jgi:hypothetical protein
MTDRRSFLKLIPIACITLVVPSLLQAAPAMLSETDAVAQSLGYRANAKLVDKKLFPRHADGQACHNCVLYQGGSAAQGGCPIFAGKNVAAAGWCNSYNKA